MKKNIVITLIAAMTFTGILAGCSGTEEILEEEDDLSSETAET